MRLFFIVLYCLFLYELYTKSSNLQCIEINRARFMNLYGWILRIDRDQLFVGCFRTNDYDKSESRIVRNICVTWDSRTPCNYAVILSIRTWYLFNRF